MFFKKRKVPQTCKNIDLVAVSVAGGLSANWLCSTTLLTLRLLLFFKFILRLKRLIKQLVWGKLRLKAAPLNLALTFTKIKNSRMGKGRGSKQLFLIVWVPRSKFLKLVFKPQAVTNYFTKLLGKIYTPLWFYLRAVQQDSLPTPQRC